MGAHYSFCPHRTVKIALTFLASLVGEVDLTLCVKDGGVKIKVSTNINYETNICSLPLEGGGTT